MSAILTILLEVAVKAFGQALVQIISNWQAAQAQRELGAAREADAARQEAERQEEAARKAGEAAEGAPEADNDPFLRPD